MSKTKVAILGAGIVGLSVALRLVEEYGSSVEITIISEAFLQQTTSYGSGGLWEPYAIEGTPDDVLNRWGRLAFEHFRDEFLKPTGDKAGVQLMSVYTLLEAHQDESPPSWSDIVYNFQRLTREDIQRMGLPTKYVKGYTFGTYVVDQKYYLQCVTRQLESRGVKQIQRRINSIEEVINFYDSVINCCGLGSYVVANDTQMYPIRGQVLRVKAPWMKNVWFFGSSYIIPNVDNVVLGGTTQKGDWDTTVSLEDTRIILDRIAEVFPSVALAPIENIWVGLRPGRSPVRLEASFVKAANGKDTQLIHCYGHGGSGITLAMGCASEIVKNYFNPWFNQRKCEDASKLSNWIRFRAKL